MLEPSKMSYANVSLIPQLHWRQVQKKRPQTWQCRSNICLKGFSTNTERLFCCRWNLTRKSVEIKSVYCGDPDNYAFYPYLNSAGRKSKLLTRRASALRNHKHKSKKILSSVKPTKRQNVPPRQISSQEKGDYVGVPVWRLPRISLYFMCASPASSAHLSFLHCWFKLRDILNNYLAQWSCAR